MSRAVNFVVVLALSAILGTSVNGPTLAASAPLGFTIMCLKQPAECRGGGAPKVVATAEVMATLQRVNGRVNRAIRPREDGSVDVWTVNATSGDCEDYALTKRRQLISAGIPASSLRIAFVKTRGGQEHAILVVNTDQGKLVLDNLTGVIKPLSQTRYRIIATQTTNPKKWI